MIQNLAEIISELHSKWTPHAGQIPLGSALFYQGYKNIFAQLGRNVGKTDFAAYATWRWAMQNPGSENYIFEPLQNQAREILWSSNRIQDFGPESWIDSINKTEMRIVLNNGSFIKLDGADNEDSRRGIKPKGLIVYDEFKDHKKSFIDSMEPNRAAHNSPALFLGTPPEFHNHYVDYANYAETDPAWFFMKGPTSINPFISKKWLEDKKRMLYAMGDEETWIREYEAVFVKGGKRHIFPQYLKYTRKPFTDLLPKDLNHWHLVTTFDPGSTTTFAVLFALFNPYTKKLLLMDEIYEQSMGEMTTLKIYGRVQKKIDMFKKMGVKKFAFVYDSAAAWFRNEMSALCDWSLDPCDKVSKTIDEGVSMIRDLFYNESIEVSTLLEKFNWEMENYLKDDKGRAPIINDHLIDCLAPDTIVITDKGPKLITDLVGTEGRVLSFDGHYFDYTFCGKTRTDSEMIELTFNDGHKLRCTKDHLIMSDTTWVKAEDMLGKSAHKVGLCKSKLSQRRLKNIMAKSIIFVESIFKETEYAFIEKYGKITTVKYLMVFMCTILTTIDQIMNYIIYHASVALNILVNIILGIKDHLQNNVGKPQTNGMAAKKVFHGIISTIKKLWISFMKRLKRNVPFVIKSTLQAVSTQENTALIHVNQKEGADQELITKLDNVSCVRESLQSINSEKTLHAPEYVRVLSIQKINNSDTYCLKVPFVHAFAVNQGILVHNCLRYKILALDFGFKDEAPPKEPDHYLERRAYRIDEDFSDGHMEMEID